MSRTRLNVNIIRKNRLKLSSNWEWFSNLASDVPTVGSGVVFETHSGPGVENSFWTVLEPHMYFVATLEMKKSSLKFRIQILRKPTNFDAFFEHNLVFTFGCTHFAVQDFEMFPCYTNFDVITFKSQKSFCTQFREHQKYWKMDLLRPWEILGQTIELLKISLLVTDVNLQFSVSLSLKRFRYASSSQ